MTKASKTRRAPKSRPQTSAPLRRPRVKEAKLAPVEPDQILGRAMLANVNIAMWDGRKHDREVTAHVAEEYKASPEAGRYHKHLFGGKVKELSALVTAAATLRGVHYEQTLPWSDSGWRLLPTANYMEYTERMRKARARFDAAAEAFVAAYPRLVRNAEEKLHKMYRAEDYPRAADVRRKYRVALEFSPLPAGSDFRIQLPEAEMARVAKDVEDRLVKSVKLAMKEAWKRLGDVIVNLRERLDDGKYLRDSMIDDIKEVAEALGRLNVTGDKALDDARAAVLKELVGFDAETLRKDEKVRSVAAQKADEILKAMSSVYAPPTDDESEDA